MTADSPTTRRRGDVRVGSRMSQESEATRQADQVRIKHTKLLLSHVQLVSMIAAGFAGLIGLLVDQTLPGGLTTGTCLWMGATSLIGLARAWQAWAFFGSPDKGAAHWRPTFLVLTGLFACAWGALTWVVPLARNSSLAVALVGSVIGIAAAGVSMLNVDRIASRVWMVPTLGSAALYSAHSGEAFGWYGFVTVSGFLLVLWLEAGRMHNRINELIRLRFQSEQLAMARAQALEEANALSDAKGRFLAIMSHEMRTPVCGMLGLSRLLREDLSQPASHLRMDLLQHAGEHLLSVIGDVLDFSRLKEGMLELRPRPLNLTPLVEQACALANVSAQEKGLSLNLSSDLPPTLWVKADGDRLRQVLLNLLGNAVKFTDRGHIHLRMQGSVQRQAGLLMLHVEVSDTGIGIPPEELAKVFDAFHQVDNRVERRAPGSGLGLSIAQQICRAMKGEIHCESEVAVGTTFHVSLPLQLDREPAAAPAEPPAAQAQDSAEPADNAPLRGTVLLVEDNPVNTLVTQAELAQLGLKVATADNGRSALAWLAQHQADLVLMDCHMPEMGGVEATRRIRARESSQGTAPMPIVALSASTLDQDRAACLAAGMNDYVVKPIAPRDLAWVVRRHLQGALQTSF